MNIKSNFNIKDLEKHIKKQIEENPEVVLKQNAGKTIETECPKCGHKGIKATNKGDAECPKCKSRIKINLNCK